MRWRDSYLDLAYLSARLVRLQTQRHAWQEAASAD
jgi:hypothetical protein